MFWIMSAAMVVLVAVAILLPFLRARPAQGSAPAAAYDLRVYRDQMAEIDRDLSRGVLSADEAGPLRAEIGRKMIEADRAMAAQPARSVAGPGPLAAALVLALLIAGAAALYLREGRPAMPDQPLRARLAAADALLANRPSQQQAEAQAPKLTPPPADPEYVALIEKLREAVRTRPDDPRGLALLAEHESRLGNLVAAREAQARLVALLGDKATAEDHARLAALMIQAAGGPVSTDASAELDRALAVDPQNGQALYMRGLMYLQVDRPDLTFPIWAGLLERGPADAIWTQPIRQLIGDVAWLAGHPDYQPPAQAAPVPGPDAAAVADAASMTPQQQEMIRGMVDRLETRLAAQGGTPEEWGRLIVALSRLGNVQHAQEIHDEALTRFAGLNDALAIIARAAADAGLAPGTSPAPGPGQRPGAATAPSTRPAPLAGTAPGTAAPAAAPAGTAVPGASAGAPATAGAAPAPSAAPARAQP